MGAGADTDHLYAVIDPRQSNEPSTRSVLPLVTASLQTMTSRLLAALLVSTLVLPEASIASAHNDHGHEHAPSFSSHFVENKGQWAHPFLFRADVRGATVFAERGGLTWVKLDPLVFDQLHHEPNMTQAEKDALSINGHAWRVRFVDGNPAPEMSGEGRADFHHNYFLGNDPSRWKSRVPLFERVRYDGIWPGVDMLMHLKDGVLKYDLLMEAGADHKDIALQYEELDDMRIGTDGSLILFTSVGDVLEMRPEVFYADGAREPIDCRYVLDGRTLRFHFPKGYDQSRSVVIDPVLIASTLSGATGSSNWGHCATYDNAGNIYTGARCFGPTYPVTSGAFQNTFGGGGTDVSISKYNPDGSQLLYATYLGGSNGDIPHSMVVSNEFELCVYSSTQSNNYPTTPGAHNATLNGTMIAITRFSADGSTLVGSTFVGGSGTDGTNAMFGNYGETYRGEIFLDNASNIVVASFTNSSNFPTTAGAFQPSAGGAQDGVAFALDPTCSDLVWSTYLGGSGDDGAMGIRVAENGDILVTGATASSNFPTTAGAYQTTFQGGGRDAYVVRLNPNATGMVAASFFGTSAMDRAYFIDTARDGAIWIYGQTEGQVAIQPAGTYGQPGGRIFLAKFDEALSEAQITTTIGPGSGTTTAPVAFLVDVCDNIYISGFNSSTGFPLTGDAFYNSGSFYLAAFSMDMEELLFGTYYGGSHVDGGTSRFDKNGIVYQGVCSGSGSMQTTPWAWATNQSIGWDIGVFKIDFEQSGVLATAQASATSGCAPAVIDFAAAGNAVTYTWDFGDGTPQQTGDQASHEFPDPGNYIVMLIGEDPTTCNLADTAYVNVIVHPSITPQVSFTASQNDPCSPYTYVFTNTSSPLEGFITSWQMGDGTIFGTQNATHTYPGPGEYTVTLTMSEDLCGNSGQFQLPIELLPPPPVEPYFELLQGDLCESLNVVTINGSSGGPSGLLSFVWDLGDGTVVEDTNAFHSYFTPGVYTITLTATDTLCGDQASYTVDVELEPPVVIEELLTVPNVFTPNGDGKNDTFFPLPETGGRVDLKVFNRWGRIVYESTSGFKPWNGNARPGDKVPDGVYYYLLEYDIPCAGTSYSGRREGHVQLLR